MEHTLTFSVAIANQYGEGVTGKAVSTYFERARKETHWNLANTLEENGAAPKSTPRKRAPKSTPKKAPVNEDEDDDEGSSFGDTPSKKAKTALNKVKGGRVSKTPRGAAAVKKSYAEAEDDEEDFENGGPAKNEDDNGSHHSFSNGMYILSLFLPNSMFHE
jgi:hypothetical protein